VAASLCGLLADEGYTVVGPACSVGDAFAAVADNRIDAALLDVRLGDDQRVFELVEALAALRKPFAFLSGYSRNLMPLKYRHHPHLEKPYPSSRVLVWQAPMDC